MYIYRHLFTDEYAREHKRQILRKLWMNIGQIDIYLIFLNQGQDQFDIIASSVLKQKHYPKKDLHLLGIAKGWESAATLSGEIYSHFAGQYETLSFKDALTADKKTLFRRF